MRSFRRLLLESFENELNEANQYYVDEISKREELSDEFFCVLKDKYSFDDINDLLLGHFPKILQRKRLFDLAATFFNKDYSYVTASDGSKVMFIPIFKYLFDGKTYDYDDFCKLYMTMHLIPDKIAAYQGFMDYGKAPFKFDIVDKMDLMMNSNDYYIGINTVIEILNFIGYENEVNNFEYNKEYIETLNSVVGTLHNYLNFWSTKEDISRVEEARRNGKKCEISENYDNLSLVRFTLGKVPYTKNPIIQLAEIEKLLQTGNEVQMKKNLLTAFAYKEYDPNDSFFDAFKDVSLTVDDIKSFICEYEKSGRRLSTDQFGNIIVNMRKSYLAREDEEILSDTVKEAYKTFRKKEYVSSDLVFIEEFARNNNGVLFDRCDFERIINGNYLYDFRELESTKSFKNYCKATGYYIENDDEAINRYSSEALRREEIWNRYYAKLFLHQDSTDETMGYFIRNNVLSSDLLDFNELKAWFEQSSQFYGWNEDESVKAKCAIKLLEDFEDELEENNFIDRFSIHGKYLKYASQDGVRKYASPKDFKKSLEIYEARFKNENAWALLGEVCIAYENKESLAERIFNLGLTVEDALDMFNILSKKADPEFRSTIEKVSEKLRADEVIRDEESKNTKIALKNKMYRDLVVDYLSTDGLNVKTYCKLRGISPARMQDAINYCRENDVELCEEYNYRNRLIRSGKYTATSIPVDIVKKIGDGIVSGVEKEDGTKREFNYLDFKLITDSPIGVFVTAVLNGPEFNYSKADVEKIKAFTLANARPTYYKEEIVLKTKEEVVVNGEAVEISKDNKQAAFDYIDALELPHEMRIYQIVSRGIVDGSIKTLMKDNKTSEKILEK